MDLYTNLVGKQIVYSHQTTIGGARMSIGKKIKNLRIQKNLTQEELAERTGLSKGYISQLEHNSSSPAMDTFFNILEVLGTTPSEFFNEQTNEQKVVYDQNEQTVIRDEDNGYQISWLIPESNEKEMEPILLDFEKNGEYKQFPPSMSETFAYILTGEVSVTIGKDMYTAKAGESIYYIATAEHQIKNNATGKSQILLVATESYL